jgi:hypothetical protein
MRIAMRAFVVMWMACLVSGCNPRFVQSSQPNAATVTFRNLSPGYIVIHKYSDNERCTDPQGITTIEPQDEYVVKFDAQQITTFTVGYMAIARVRSTLGSETCQFVGSFVPKPDHGYLVVVATDADKCYIAMFNGAEQGRENVEKSFVSRPYKQPFLSKSEGFCAALDEKSRQVLDSAK